MNIESYIENAIQEGKSITIKYIKYNGEISIRTISDLRYSEEFGSDYIEGYCHLRQEKRTFKISRIKEVDGISSSMPSVSLGKTKTAYNPHTSTKQTQSTHPSPSVSPSVYNSNNRPSSTNYSVKQNSTYSSQGSKKAEGCYIATMVYGDYDHPKVLVLRQYRDEYLMKSIWGRCFIRFYYYLSPKVVRILYNKENINNLIRKWLDSFIKNHIYLSFSRNCT